MKVALKKVHLQHAFCFIFQRDTRGGQETDANTPLLLDRQRRLGKQDNLVQGLEDVAQGAITVELASEHIAEFDTYMASLTPYNNVRNPWFREYWETIFQCGLDPAAAVPCDPSLRLLPENGFVQESKVQFVIDAVYTYAHALQSLHRDVCGDRKNVCPEMRKYDGGEFYKKYLLNVSFRGKLRQT